MLLLNWVPGVGAGVGAGAGAGGGAGGGAGDSQHPSTLVIKRSATGKPWISNIANTPEIRRN